MNTVSSEMAEMLFGISWSKNGISPFSSKRGLEPLPSKPKDQLFFSV
jgi:hypothetical protein